jgi:ribosomal protein S18 acetylase RimI-like enzyme
VIIRPIDSSETIAVSELLVTAYISGGHLSEDSPYILELRDVASRLKYTWVAEIGGTIVGAITLCPPDGSSPAMLGRDNEYEFRFLAVSPDSWGSGVGQALVTECEAQAIAYGAKKMVISVVDLNERALNFYALQGYTRIPERDWSPERTPDPQAVNSANTTPVQILALTKNL